MESPDKPTRRRSSKAKAEPPVTPLPDLLSGLPAPDADAPVEAAAKPVRKRAAPRKNASIDTTTPSAPVQPSISATAVDPKAAQDALPAAAKAAPKPRVKRSPPPEPVVEVPNATPSAASIAAPSRPRPKPPAEQPTAEQPPAEQPPAEKPTAEQPTAEKPTAEKPEAEKPEAEKPEAEKPRLPAAAMLPPASEATPKPVPAPTSKPAPIPPSRPRKPIPPSAEVQDALPLPAAPPWSIEAPASHAPRAASATARPADASSLSLRVIDAVLRVLPERHRPRWRDYLMLMRMDRPVGALLLLWPTWWALWFAAGGVPSFKLFAIFTVGVFVMRAAGCVINDYADHDWLDANVERTRGRPMAAGRVSRKEALLLFGGLLLIAFALVLFTNPLTIALSFAGAALAAIYPFAKRVTHLAQVVLGAAFGWSIPMAFAATLGEVPALGWLLFLANVLFSVIYDTQYAMVDRDEDIRVGSKSTAILFGEADRAILGVLMLSFVITLLLAGSRADLAWPWTAGVAVAALLLGWQQSLIRDRDRDACFAAFRNNNWVGFVIWLGLVAAQWLKVHPPFAS